MHTADLKDPDYGCPEHEGVSGGHGKEAPTMPRREMPDATDLGVGSVKSIISSDGGYYGGGRIPYKNHTDSSLFADKSPVYGSNQFYKGHNENDRLSANNGGPVILSSHEQNFIGPAGEIRFDTQDKEGAQAAGDAFENLLHAQANLSKEVAPDEAESPAAVETPIEVDPEKKDEPGKPSSEEQTAESTEVPSVVTDRLQASYQKLLELVKSEPSDEVRQQIEAVFREMGRDIESVVDAKGPEYFNKSKEQLGDILKAVPVTSKGIWKMVNEELADIRSIMEGNNVIPVAE